MGIPEAYKSQVDPKIVETYKNNEMVFIFERFPDGNFYPTIVEILFKGEEAETARRTFVPNNPDFTREEGFPAVLVSMTADFKSIVMVVNSTEDVLRNEHTH